MAGRRPAAFRQADVAKALKAAMAAGLDVTGCRIAPGGVIDLQFAGARPGKSELEIWQEKRRHDAR
jgi:hypothetical protein